MASRKESSSPCLASKRETVECRAVGEGVYGEGGVGGGKAEEGRGGSDIGG